jgi:TonB-linked SusC/RagA family outer membrane protein
MIKNLRAICLFVLCLGAIYSVQAQTSQNRVITGTVKDEMGVSLPGVGVAIKGARTAVSTNQDGKYSIPVPPSATTLVFSFIGMTSEEIAVGNRTVINMTLRSSATNLNDVVVIGYGTQKRQDVNGAISSISAKDIANVPQPSVDQLLQGKASGVTITQNSGAPGSQTSVRVRGITSLSLSNEPLYVIDGVPISGDASNRSTSGRSPMLSQNNGATGVSPLSTISPNDIESIDVLKDASATAIYGARGSNGVIIITTKRGKNGTSRIAYDGYAGVQEQNRFLDMMDLKAYANLQNALAEVYGTAKRGEFADPTLLGAGTDWQKEIFQSAAMQSHQLSISGGKEGTDYYISGGYLKQDGTVIGNDFDRFSLRSNVNGKVKEWFKVGANVSGSRTNQNSVLTDNTGIVYNALLSAPDNAVYNADGTFAGPLANQIGGTINPVAQAMSLTNTLLRSNFNGSVFGDLQFTKDLSLRSEFNADYSWSDALTFNPTYEWGIFQNKVAVLNKLMTNNTFWGWKEYLNYNKTIGKHSITGLLGYEVNESTWGGVTSSVQNFNSNDVPTLNLGDAKTATNSEFKGSQVLESFFARAIYTFNEKYSVTATVRRDRSSKFAEGNQTGYFPSFAASWKLSDENFMNFTKSFANNIKVRVGYGEVGNQGVPNYLYGSALSPSTTGLGTGFTVDKVPNPELTWETAQQTNAGIDISFLNSRIDFTFDWFSKDSKNFLFQKPLPAYLLGGSASYSTAAVISAPYINGGNMNNKGFDFSITSRNFVGNKFRWNTSVVFSRYKNEVKSLASGIPFISANITNGFLSVPVTKTVVGGPVGEFYGHVVKDIFRTPEQLRAAAVQFGRPVENSSGGTWLGDIQFEDLNGDGVINENDMRALGSPQPTFTYGITNTFSYSNFDLSIFLNGSQGGKILNALKYTTAGLASLYQNQLAESANFWTPTNTGSNIPAPKSGTDNPNLKMSDRFLESASFLRIQNVNLGYNLPSNVLKPLRLSRLKTYVSVQNLYTFTKYSGLDPEIGSTNQNVFLTNVDLGRYPIPRTITFGINAEF